MAVVGRDGETSHTGFVARQAIGRGYVIVVFPNCPLPIRSDISIWLCQSGLSRTAYIHMLVSRISKLLFYKIYPIFVFDGRNVPALKRQTLVGIFRRHPSCSSILNSIFEHFRMNVLFKGTWTKLD